MAEVKMTRKEMFAHIAEVMADEPEIVEFCEKQIAVLGKPRKPSKASLEAAEFRKDVAMKVAEFEGEFMAKEVAEAMDVKVQKVSAALTKLAAEGFLMKDGSRSPIVYKLADADAEVE